MKCNLTYKSAEIFIPSLPEADWEGDDECYWQFTATNEEYSNVEADWEGDDECYWGAEELPNAALAVYSAYGETRFYETSSQKIEEVAGGFFVRSSTGVIIAEYAGAYNALNARRDIEFPECEINNIQSTLGEFKTADDYELAREFLLPCQQGLAKIYEDVKRLHGYVTDPYNIYSCFFLKKLEQLALTQKEGLEIFNLLNKYSSCSSYSEQPEVFVNPPLQTLVNAIQLLKSASPEALELWLQEPGTEFEKDGVIYSRRREGGSFRLDEEYYALTLTAHQNTPHFWKVSVPESLEKELQQKIIPAQTSCPIKLSILGMYYNNYLWINAQNVIAFAKFLSGNISRQQLPHYGCMKDRELEFALREQGFVPGEAFILVDDTFDEGRPYSYKISAFELRNRMKRIMAIRAAAAKKLPSRIKYEYEEVRDDSAQRHYNRRMEHDPKRLARSPEKLRKLYKNIKKQGGCLEKTLTRRYYDFSGPSWAHDEGEEDVAIIRYTLLLPQSHPGGGSEL